MNTLYIIRRVQRFILPRAIRKMVWAGALAFCLPAGAAAEDYNYVQVITNCCTDNIARTEVRRLTFADGNLVMTKADGTNVNFGLAVLKGIAFTSNADGIRTLNGTKGQPLFLQGERLVTGQTGLLFIYDSLGRLIRQEYVGESHNEMNLSDLKRGLYIARIGNQTLKFIR